MTPQTVLVNSSGSRARPTVDEFAFFRKLILAADKKAPPFASADATPEEIALYRKLQFADTFWNECTECPISVRAMMASSTRAVLCENTIFDSFDLKRLSVKIVDGVFKKIDPATLSLTMKRNPTFELVLLVKTQDFLEKLL